MFPSQMVRLKIVFLSNGPLYPCFPRKWHDLKSFSSQTLSVFPRKWSTLSMFPSQMVRLKILFLSNGPLYPCFPRKWYTLKLFSSQMVYFIHVSLTNGTP